jgi:hypothetical protein
MRHTAAQHKLAGTPMADTIVLDLRFRVVRPDHQIFAVFPGHGYFLYPSFVSQSRIFPELPGLDLVAGTPIAEQPDLEKKVYRSRRIANWYASRKRQERPPRRLSSYSQIRRTRELSQTIGVLTGFFGRAEKGDLVVVPPHRISDRVLIGELLDPPDTFREITVPEFWENEKVPSRRVRWLAFPRRGDLSVELQQRLPSPNAFRLLDPEVRAEVYSLAYGSYSIADGYINRFDVTTADFNTIDDYYLQEIFNTIGALTELHDIGNLKDKAASLGGFGDIIANLTDNSYISDLRIDISSPGSLILSCSKLVPLIASGILALTLLGADATWEAAEAGKIHVENSHAPDDDICTPKVSAAVLDEIKVMGYARWKLLCERAEALRKRTGLTEQSKASITPKQKIK